LKSAAEATLHLCSVTETTRDEEYPNLGIFFIAPDSWRVQRGLATAMFARSTLKRLKRKVLQDVNQLMGVVRANDAGIEPSVPSVDVQISDIDTEIAVNERKLREVDNPHGGISSMHEQQIEAKITALRTIRRGLVANGKMTPKLTAMLDDVTSVDRAWKARKDALIDSEQKEKSVKVYPGASAAAVSLPGTEKPDAVSSKRPVSPTDVVQYVTTSRVSPDLSESTTRLTTAAEKRSLQDQASEKLAMVEMEDIMRQIIAAEGTDIKVEKLNPKNRLILKNQGGYKVSVEKTGFSISWADDAPQGSVD